MHQKKSSVELKQIARTVLIEHYKIPMGAIVIAFIISTVTTFILNALFSGNSIFEIFLNFLTSIIISLLLSVLSVGHQVIALKISRKMDTSFSDLFYGFYHQPDRIIILTLLLFLISFASMVPGTIIIILGAASSITLLTLLGILLMLAGIVFMVVWLLFYAQVFYIYIETPDKKVMEIMRESKTIMSGNKGRYFYLQLSFLGLILLSALSAGIGLLWVSPYIETTSALFYLNIKGEVS